MDMDACMRMACLLVLAGILAGGCTTAEERAQGSVDQNIVLGPGETSKDYYIIIPDSKITAFSLTSDRPVDIACSDWPDISEKGVTDFSTRIQTGGIPSKGPVLVPLPGSKFTVRNPDPDKRAHVHITLTGIRP